MGSSLDYRTAIASLTTIGANKTGGPQIRNINQMERESKYLNLNLSPNQNLKAAF